MLEVLHVWFVALLYALLQRFRSPLLRVDLVLWLLGRFLWSLALEQVSRLLHVAPLVAPCIYGLPSEETKTRRFQRVLEAAGQGFEP
jgi:hypothetical protein